MMIRHDDPHAQFPGPCHFLDTGNAAVNGNQQLGTRRYLFNGRNVEAVSLPVPVRNVVSHAGPLFTEPGHHNGGGRNAVHVIVAENGNFLLAFHGIQNDRHGLVHILHEERIVQVRFHRAQVPLDFCPGPPSAFIKKLQQFLGRIDSGNIRWKDYIMI